MADNDLPFRDRDIRRALMLVRTSNNAHGFTNVEILSEKVDNLPPAAKLELVRTFRNIADGLESDIRSQEPALFETDMKAQESPVSDANVIEEGAKILASWIHYSWDGLGERDISDQLPDWATNGVGSLRMQGGRPALRKVAAKILTLHSTPPVDLSRGYPHELTEDLRAILSLMMWNTGPMAHALRDGGQDIKRKAEDEQAEVMHWLIGLALEHGSEWRAKASDRIREIQASVKAAASEGSIE